VANSNTSTNLTLTWELILHNANILLIPVSASTKIAAAKPSGPCAWDDDVTVVGNILLMHTPLSRTTIVSK